MDNDDNNDNTELLMIVNNNNSSYHENINNKNPTARKKTLMINGDYFQIQLIQLTKNYLSIHLISGKIS